MSSKSSIQNIFKLSIPIFFANLVIPFVAIVDTGLMGNLDNASYLVATSIAASVFSILFGSFGFLRSGTVGMIAQADGSKDYEEIINIFLRNIAFVIIISLLLVILQTYIYNISLSIFDLSYDFTIEQLFAKDKQETEQYFDFQNEFSREDNVFLLVHENPALINNQFLDSLSVLVRQMKVSNFFIDLVSLADIKKGGENRSNDPGFDHISSRLLNI